MADEVTLQHRFLETALRRSQFLQANDPTRANKEYDALHELKNELRRLPDRGEAVLKRIIQQGNDVEVRISAAAALLAVDEAFALKIVDEIALMDLGLSSFTAEMTASEWRAGHLRDYWG